MFQPSPRSMHSHHKSKKTRNSHLCNTFSRTTCTPSPLRGEASRFTPQNNSWRKTKESVVLLSQIAKSTCAKKACQRQNRVSYCLHRTPATLGKRYPLRKGFSPRYSATYPSANTQPLQATLLRKRHLFQAPVRKALRVRPEPIVEKTGLEPVTSRKPSGCTTKLCYIPKRPEPKRKELNNNLNQGIRPIGIHGSDTRQLQIPSSIGL